METGQYTIISFQEIETIIKNNWENSQHPSLYDNRRQKPISFLEYSDHYENDVIMKYPYRATKYNLNKIENEFDRGFNVIAFCYWWLTGNKEDGVYNFSYCDKVDTLFDTLASLDLIPEGNYLVRVSW